MTGSFLWTTPASGGQISAHVPAMDRSAIRADRIVTRMLPNGDAYNALPDGTTYQRKLATYRLDKIPSYEPHAGDLSYAQRIKAKYEQLALEIEVLNRQYTLG